MMPVVVVAGAALVSVLNPSIVDGSTGPVQLSGGVTSVIFDTEESPASAQKAAAFINNLGRQRLRRIVVHRSGCREVAGVTEASSGTGAGHSLWIRIGMARPEDRKVSVTVIGYRKTSAKPAALHVVLASDTREFLPTTAEFRALHWIVVAARKVHCLPEEAIQAHRSRPRTRACPGRFLPMRTLADESWSKDAKWHNHLEHRPAAGPYRSLAALKASLTAGRRSDDCEGGSRIRVRDTGPAVTSRSGPIRSARLFRVSDRLSCGPVVDECVVALRTRRGWFVQTAPYYCNGRIENFRRRTTESKLRLVANARVVAWEYTWSDLTFRGKKGWRKTWSHGRFLRLCGVVASGRAACTRPIPLRCWGHRDRHQVSWLYRRGRLQLRGKRPESVTDVDCPERAFIRLLLPGEYRLRFR